MLRNYNRVGDPGTKRCWLLFSRAAPSRVRQSASAKPVSGAFEVRRRGSGGSESLVGEESPHPVEPVAA